MQRKEIKKILRDKYTDCWKYPEMRNRIKRKGNHRLRQLFKREIYNA